MQLELVKNLDPFREGQTLELFRYGDKYFCVSTLEEVSVSDVGDQAILDMASLTSSMFGGGLTSDEPYASSGPETLVCLSDKEGTLDLAEEVVYISGEESRKRALEQLKEVLSSESNDD